MIGHGNCILLRPRYSIKTTSSTTPVVALNSSIHQSLAIINSYHQGKSRSSLLENLPDSRRSCSATMGSSCRFLRPCWLFARRFLGFFWWPIMLLLPVLDPSEILCERFLVRMWRILAYMRMYIHYRASHSTFYHSSRNSSLLPLGSGTFQSDPRDLIHSCYTVAHCT